MTTDDPTTGADALEEQLWDVQSSVASVNSEAAAAVRRASGLIDDSRPAMSLSGTHDELLDAYAELVCAIDTVERALDDINPDYGNATPRQVKSEHADRFKERYDGPVIHLALDLLEHNRRNWLHGKPGTEGAADVRRHGLTENQRFWLDSLQDLVDDAGSEPATTIEEVDVGSCPECGDGAAAVLEVPTYGTGGVTVDGTVTVHAESLGTDGWRLYIHEGGDE